MVGCAIYMEITGQEEEGRLVAPNQPRGHHRRLSLLHSSSIFVCVFAFLLCLLFFFVFYLSAIFYGLKKGDLRGTGNNGVRMVAL